MKEELTKKMHSEFTVSKETETKHKVWALLEEAKRRNIDPISLTRRYGIDEADISTHFKSYLRLNK